MKIVIIKEVLNQTELPGTHMLLNHRFWTGIWFNVCRKKVLPSQYKEYFALLLLGFKMIFVFFTVWRHAADRIVIAIKPISGILMP